jgi:hypothetical protein
MYFNNLKIQHAVPHPGYSQKRESNLRSTFTGMNQPTADYTLQLWFSWSFPCCHALSV